MDKCQIEKKKPNMVLSLGVALVKLEFEQKKMTH